MRHPQRQQLIRMSSMFRSGAPGGEGADSYLWGMRGPQRAAHGLEKGVKMLRGGRVVLNFLSLRLDAQPLFLLRAPAEPTQFGITMRGKISAICLDIFPASPGRGDWTGNARVLKIEGVGGSDLLPVAITSLSEEQEACAAELIFRPASRRLKGKLLGSITKAYSESLPIIAVKFSEVGTISAFHAVCKEGAEAVRRPCMDSAPTVHAQGEENFG